MEDFSKKYAEVQVLLLNIRKASSEYEEHDQTAAHSQALVHAFSKTFNAFCDLISEYLSKHSKHFTAGKNAQEIITHAHQAGFLAEHDTKILLKAAQEKEASSSPHQEVSEVQEIPLIHNLETYLETMQTVISDIKP